MATLNIGIKISAAISNLITGTSGTLYTVPANSYSIFQVHFLGTTSTGSYELTVATRRAWVGYFNGTAILNNSMGGNTTITNAGLSTPPLYAGPGQAIAFTRPLSDQVVISGVTFVNTQ